MGELLPLKVLVHFNPIALRTAKTLWSFGRSECNRVKHKYLCMHFDVLGQGLSYVGQLGVGGVKGAVLCVDWTDVWKNYFSLLCF